MMNQLVACILLLSLPLQAQSAETHIYINSGGPSFTYDSALWDADRNFVGGNTFADYNLLIDGTDMDTLY